VCVVCVSRMCIHTHTYIYICARACLYIYIYVCVYTLIHTPGGEGGVEKITVQQFRSKK